MAHPPTARRHPRRHRARPWSGNGDPRALDGLGVEQSRPPQRLRAKRPASGRDRRTAARSAPSDARGMELRGVGATGPLARPSSTHCRRNRCGELLTEICDRRRAGPVRESGSSARTGSPTPDRAGGLAARVLRSSYDRDLSAGSSGFQVTHRLGRFREPVGLVDDRRQATGFSELGEDLDVGLGFFGNPDR